jgi:hypothetical protein
VGLCNVFELLDDLLGVVDRPFSNDGQLMYHEVFIYVEDRDGSTWYLIPQHLNFCKRNVCTPAWVYNVINVCMDHS